MPRADIRRGLESVEPQITIRAFEQLEEMRVCEQLQQQVWKYSEIEVVPHNVFVVAHKTGGEVLGAFEEGRAIGFALAFPAFHSSGVYLHSHMTAVLPQHQNRGVGRSLKLAQRERALARGINVIEWTFDPLQIRNAHFNIARLGALARRYLPDFYGRSSSILHGGLPTDRLLAEWRLDSNRVEAAIQGISAGESAKHERIWVPGNISELCQSDPQMARQIQARVRHEFEQAFQDSYAVTGFALEKGRGAYLMEKYED